jgi:mRNA interferase YafQ
MLEATLFRFLGRINIASRSGIRTFNWWHESAPSLLAATIKGQPYPCPLEAVLNLLIAGKQLPASYHDHMLQGGYWRGCRECHIQPDWLLIYRNLSDEIELVRTGTHSDLFG